MKNITDNERVVIIGGGPGGTACGLALQLIANEMGLPIHITLIEGKQFRDGKHYNQCVGVLSPPLPQLLEEKLGIPFPLNLCQIEIQGYVLHSSGEQIQLEGDDETSYAVRRVQFDQYMLDKVRERGIDVFPGRAIDLEFHDDRVIVYTESLPLEADVVVGAFGLDDGSAAMFTRHTAYRPPKAIDSLVTKYCSNANTNSNNLGGFVHAYLLSNPRIEFGAITPKCDHKTINIAGNTVDAPLMDTFLDDPIIRAVLPDLDRGNPSEINDLVYFKGRFPRSLAQGYYGDRYVMIGDASGLVRAFKGKGVTTAVMTGIRAAETILKHGYSKDDFHKHYRSANQDIIQDLPFGRAMRILTIFMSRIGLMDPVLRAAQSNPELREALYDAVSAHALFREVFAKILRPRPVWAILKAMVPGSTP